MKIQSFYQLTITFISIVLNTQIYAHGEELKKLWETEGFMNPESVVYDKATNTLYVSNVNGAPNEKDGNGFISKVSLEGEILDKEWVADMDAPKGLAISNGKLYVADIDTLIEIDIASASITNRYQVADAKFLNDVAASPAGEIFVSDMAANRIHVLKDGQFSIWLESPDLESPNGLLVQGDNLILGAWGVMTEGFSTAVPGHLKSISLKDKTITSLGDGSPIGNLDGVEADLDGDFYVTDWMVGKLFHIGRGGEAEVLLTLEQGMADHEYIQQMDLIILPMMMGNKLIAYKVH